MQDVGQSAIGNGQPPGTPSLPSGRIVNRELRVVKLESAFHYSPFLIHYFAVSLRLCGKALSRFRILMCIGVLALAGAVSAQSAPGSQTPGSKYYVWGQVRSPGAYSFIASPDIVELLSAGGGPTENANLGRVVLIRAVTQKRTRIDLQKMMGSGQILRLAPGDVVIVPSSPWYNLRDWLAVVTSVGTVVTLVLTIMNRAGV